MNKLFTKIGVAMVGLAMAVGVGVAVGHSDVQKTEAAAASNGYSAIELYDGAKVLITTSDTSGNLYYVRAEDSNNGNIQVSTIASINSIDEAHLWTVTKSSSNWKFSFNSSESTFYLKTTGGSNTNTRVQTGDTNSAWTVSSGASNCYKLQNSSNSRYLAVLISNSDARGYAGTSQSGTDGTATRFKFYTPYYTVAYNGNGSDGGTAVTDTSSPYVGGSTVTVKSNTYTRTNYNFVNWNTKSDGSGSSYAADATFKISENTTLYAQWETNATKYSVTDSIVNGSLSSTTPVVENESLDTLVVPATHYHLPNSLTSVTMGGNSLASGSGYTYNSSTGAVHIETVTGNIVISATCLEDSKYTVTYVAGEHGSGENFVVSNQYVGSYTLVAFNSTGLSALSGYRFKHYSVVIGEADALIKAAGETIELTDNATITAVFELIPAEIVIQYTGGTTTNMTGNNDSNSMFGLDETKWSIKSIQNDATVHIGLNKDGTIRLYADKDNGNGNLLEVGSLDSAIVIKAVTFEFGSTVGDYEVNKVVGEVATKVSSLSTTFAIDAPKFTIKNTTKASTQVHINSITAEYDYVDTFKAAQAFEAAYVKRDIEYPVSTPTGVSGTDCLSVSKGGEGYYDTAVTEYDNLSEAAKIWFATRLEFANARERMIAWAAANGTTIEFNTTTGDIQVASRLNLAFSTKANSSATIIIIVISSITLVTLAGCFMIRRRKEK